MTITGAIVLFAVIWFLVLYIMLPQGVRTQTDEGEVTPGTPGGAPVNPRLRRKVIITTIVTVILWAAAVGVIMSGWVSMDDLNPFAGPDARYPTQG